MFHRPLLASLALLITLAPLTRASTELPAAPPLSPTLTARHPVPLLPADNAEYKFYDNLSGTARPTFAILPHATPSLAYRAEVPAAGKYAYTVETKIKTILPVKNGDVALARFMARAPFARQESGEGALGFAFQLGFAPHDKSISITVTPGPEWKLYEIPFTLTRDFAAGDAVVALAFGELIQTIEIAHLEVLNFEQRATLDQLPCISFTYKGREADAPWRAAALKRIEQIRTAPLTIHVIDSAGHPLPGARVEARLIQSEFIFGSAIDDRIIVADTPDATRYRATILELFNTVVIENGLKWPTWNQGPERQRSVLSALDWISQHSLRHKGHNLVWPAWKFAPANQKDLPDLPATLPQHINTRITEMMHITKGNSFAWDVVNEPIHERDYFEHIPEASMADWFKLAHALDPNAQLFINEYSMLNSALSPGMITQFREIIKTLRTAGAPIGGIGIQGHIGQQPRAPEAVLADLDLIAAEGLPVHITEFDINTKDEALQADYTRDFLLSCYSHPSITGFIMWGFWQGQQWKPDAAMFRRDWTEKSNAAVWREWVLGKWKTHLDTTTPADGSASVRGHLGRYRITVSFDGIIHPEDITLPRAGAELTVRIPR